MSDIQWENIGDWKCFVANDRIIFQKLKPRTMRILKFKKILEIVSVKYTGPDGADECHRIQINGESFIKYEAKYAEKFWNIISKSYNEFYANQLNIGKELKEIKETLQFVPHFGSEFKKAESRFYNETNK